MADTITTTPAAEFDIIIRKEADHGKPGAYRAAIVGHPDSFGVGTYPIEALRALNFRMWNHSAERKNRERVALRRIRDEVRRAAGLPRWTWGLPSWAAPNKARRNLVRNTMWDSIIAPYCEANPKATYEEVADHAIAQWRALYGGPR